MTGTTDRDPSSPTRPAHRRGFFLALDGPDGGGKTTQVARLVDWLKGTGTEVVACRDPGGTPLGDRVRSLLLDREGPAISARAEMLLYMASRAQMVEDVIRPALEAGKVVVSDRFLLANVVYQGHAGGLPPEEVWAVGKASTGGLMPDLTLLLDIPPEVAEARVGAPRDRMEERGEAFRRKVRSGFLKEIKTYRHPILLVDAADGAEVVASKIRGEVARALGIGPRS